MELKKIDDDLWRTEDGKITAKAGVSAKPDPDNEYHSVRYTIYHLYDQTGNYVGQCKNLKGDFLRAHREWKTKIFKKAEGMNG